MWKLADFSKNTAVILENGETVSYAKLDEETRKLVTQIPNNRYLVFILCSNRLGSLVGYIGFINNGIVPVMLDAGIDRVILNGLLEAYRPSYIWLPVSMVDLFPSFKSVYWSYDYTLLNTELAFDYSLNSELALLLTTSGSTGSQKFVRQSYENIHTNTESIINYLNITEKDRAITTLPMQYTYGLSIINTHLATGALIILTQKTL
jgi:acyl-CoA synthetase (AMP-forming)/AMP-acid ligase II